MYLIVLYLIYHYYWSHIWCLGTVQVNRTQQALAPVHQTFTDSGNPPTDVKKISETDKHSLLAEHIQSDDNTLTEETQTKTNETNQSGTDQFMTDSIQTTRPADSFGTTVTDGCTVEDVGPTPRRKNLAATVLKYGEEISAKNELIRDLESQLAAIQNQGDGSRVRELESELITSQKYV